MRAARPGGTEAGHALANAALGAPEGPRELFAAPASGSHLLPVVAALAAAAALAGVGLRAVGRPRPSQPHAMAHVFASLPPMLFVLLELVESLLGGDSVSPGEAFEPTFLLGLGLQLPFAIAAYLVARLLLKAGDRLRTLLSRAPSAPRMRPAAVVFPVRAVSLRALHLVSTLRGRAPPAAPAVSG